MLQCSTTKITNILPPINYLLLQYSTVPPPPPLQCLSNTAPLTEYFLGTEAGYKPYKKHINADNPLGMGGAIAEAYGALLEDIWSGKCSVAAPRQFKVQK